MGDHGFLTRRVLARYSRLLEPIMEPGEELIGFEIFPLSALGPRFPSHNERLEAFLSNLALYLVTPLQPNRIPLTEIRKVIVEGRLVAVRLFSGQTLNLGAPLGKPRALIGRLQASVPERALNTIHLELMSDGRGVTVTEESGRPGTGEVSYDYIPDVGVDVDHEPLHSQFEEAMQQLIRNRHPDAMEHFRCAS